MKHKSNYDKRRQQEGIAVGGVMVAALMLAISVALMALTGCAEYRAIIAANGAEGADATLETAEWSHCKLPSAGALERKYQLFTNPAGPKSESWRGLCYGPKTQTP